jgi:hypothetical protein
VDIDKAFEPAPASASMLTARVIKVEGRKLTVDLGGPIEVQCLDSCNPLPDQHVYIASDRGALMAVGAVNGVYRQPTITVSSSSETSVSGYVNGEYLLLPKMGIFVPTIGDVLPLIWSADASGVWVGSKPGVPYVPPPVSGGSAGSGGGTSTGGGSTGGGGIVTTGTATYTALASGYFNDAGRRIDGNLYLNDSSDDGFYVYGHNRMNELQGRSIQWGTISMPRYSGSGTVLLESLKANSTSTLSVSPGSTVGLSGAFLSNLINGSGGTQVRAISGSGVIRGIPYGTIRIGWRSA